MVFSQKGLTESLKTTLQAFWLSVMCNKHRDGENNEIQSIPIKQLTKVLEATKHRGTSLQWTPLGLSWLSCIKRSLDL